MEQRHDDTSKTPADAVDEEVGDEEDPPVPFIERRFWLLLSATFVVAVTAGVGVTYTQYSQVGETLDSVPYVDQITQAASNVPFTDQVAQVLPYLGGEASSSQPREYGAFAELKGLIVNPAGSSGNRYLAVSLAFETKSSSVETELQNKRVVVKDAMLNLLSKRTVDELSNPDRRTELKESLREEVNSIVSSGTVNRLYFTEFVLQ